MSAGRVKDAVCGIPIVVGSPQLTTHSQKPGEKNQLYA